MADWLPPWALAELATFYITADLEDPRTARVVKNDHVPTVDGSGETRQVDVTVRYSHAGLTLLQIIEVEDRSEPIGKEGIDEILGKCEEIGAHAALLVATAGFTAPALKRISKPRPSPSLRAVHLAPLRPGELKERTIHNFSSVGVRNDSSGEVQPQMKLRPWVFRDAVTLKPLGFIFINHLVEAHGEYVIALSFPPPRDDEAIVTVRMVTKPGSKRIANRFTIGSSELSTTFRARLDGSLTISRGPGIIDGDPSVGLSTS